MGWWWCPGTCSSDLDKRQVQNPLSPRHALQEALMDHFYYICALCTEGVMSSPQVDDYYHEDDNGSDTVWLRQERRFVADDDPSVMDSLFKQLSAEWQCHQRATTHFVTVGGVGWTRRLSRYKESRCCYVKIIAITRSSLGDFHVTVTLLLGDNSTPASDRLLWSN